MDRASTLLGLRIELTLRFANPPPCSGVEHFKWPADKKSVGVFRCMENGSLEQVQRGNTTVVRRKFFRVGLPTIRSEGWIPGTVCAVHAVERLYYASGCIKEEEWEDEPEEQLGEEVDGSQSEKGSSSGLEKKRNNSIINFLEFVGEHTFVLKSPKKPQSLGTPKVTITPTASGTEQCMESEMPDSPTLGRRTKSWSGMLNDKEERAKNTSQLSPMKASIEDLPFALNAPITPKKERSGFRVPFRRRHTQDMDKGKRPLHHMPSPLIRSISACDLQSPPMAEGDAKKKDNMRMRRRSSDQKVVRFTENTRPTMEVDERWDNSGSVPKSPAPPQTCASPEPITPSSASRGPHFMAVWEDGECSDAETLVNEFNGVIQDMTTWPDPTVGRGTCGDRVDLNDTFLQPPYIDIDTYTLLPVSPPDPEYVERIESEMSKAMSDLLLSNEDKPEEKELDISEMTEEQAYAKSVGMVSQWLQFPPKQVSSEYLPKSKAHWDWRALELRSSSPFAGFSDSALNPDEGSVNKFPATF
ncbi:hypothetical protein BDD12DRAFT_848336 [Trichophaea hybrida]|nr:hypothetical protein BDD12DRAFT_848336 [Trichophaea hybrida]